MYCVFSTYSEILIQSKLKLLFHLKVTVTRSTRDHPETPKRSFCPRAASRQETLHVTRAVTRATRTWRTVMTAFLVCDSPALLFLLSVISAWIQSERLMSVFCFHSSLCCEEHTCLRWDFHSISHPYFQKHGISYSSCDFVLRFHFSPFPFENHVSFDAFFAHAEFVLNQKSEEVWSWINIIHCYSLKIWSHKCSFALV